MKRLSFLLFNLLVIQQIVVAQRVPQVPDSIRKQYQINYPREKGIQPVDISGMDQDSLIKIKLIQLTQQNSNVVIADAGIKIAEANQDLAKMSWLSSLTAGANINEFVVSNSPQANFFPKYNLGISIPFDIVSRVSREKKVTAQNLLISRENKKEQLQLLKADVLIRYETYKEKKELVLIQKNSLEYDYSGYLSAQKSYADGDTKLEIMDKAYQNYLNEKVKLVSKELDLKIAIIQLEQLIGMPLEVAIDQALRFYK
ncbi:MAG: TolC family protein [Ferruginibacter sp.]